jgi:hypothetical protein
MVEAMELPNLLLQEALHPITIRGQVVQQLQASPANPQEPIL